jgi:hypothetical protein
VLPSASMGRGVMTACSSAFSADRARAPLAPARCGERVASSHRLEAKPARLSRMALWMARSTSSSSAAQMKQPAAADGMAGVMAIIGFSVVEPIKR